MTATNTLLPLLPHHALSAMMRAATRVRFGPFRRWQIRWFIERYRVDMSEAAITDIDAYACFNDFFTRALRTDARPDCGDAGGIASPADGVISVLGDVDSDSLLQAKGMRYGLLELLGGDDAAAHLFSGGRFITIYLSPRDYHRVHMPLGGTLRRMTYIPGRLFSVNVASVASVPRLFCRNERVVSLFDTRAGQMAVIMVGAMFVGGIEQSWCGVVAPPHRNSIESTDYEGRHAPCLAHGEEMGRFHMGSTVIVLFQRNAIDWDASLRGQAGIRMGERIGAAHPRVREHAIVQG